MADMTYKQEKMFDFLVPHRNDWNVWLSNDEALYVVKICSSVKKSLRYGNVHHLDLCLTEKLLTQNFTRFGIAFLFYRMMLAGWMM